MKYDPLFHSGPHCRDRTVKVGHEINIIASCRSDGTASNVFCAINAIRRRYGVYTSTLRGGATRASMRETAALCFDVATSLLDFSRRVRCVHPCVRRRNIVQSFAGPRLECDAPPLMMTSVVTMLSSSSSLTDRRRMHRQLKSVRWPPPMSINRKRPYSIDGCRLHMNDLLKAYAHIPIPVY